MPPSSQLLCRAPGLAALASRVDKTVIRICLRVRSVEETRVRGNSALSLEEARQIFDDPAQFRAIGWCGGRLCSVIFKVRHDAQGEFHHPIKRPRRNSKAMPRTSKTAISADEIAERASRGEDISACFTRKFTVVKAVHRVNVYLTQGMLRDLDEGAARLNISRQAVIKTLRVVRCSRMGPARRGQRRVRSYRGLA